MIADLLGQPALHFEAGGADAVRARHQFAKRIFVGCTAHRKVPLLDTSQRDGQSGGGGEGARVIAINRRARQFLDQLLVAQLHQPQSYRSRLGCRKFRYASCRQRPMIRAYNAIIAAALNTIKYSIILAG
jgi:hypothetical protein